MGLFCLRIDVQGVEEEFRKIILDWLSSLGAEGIGCYECPTEDNPHYHFYVEVCKGIQAVRKSLQRLLKEVLTGAKGNKAYSLKEQEGDARYICKGHKAYKKEKKYIRVDEDEPIIILNSHNHDVDELCESFWETYRPEGVPGKKKEPTFFEKVCEKFEKEYFLQKWYQDFKDSGSHLRTERCGLQYGVCVWLIKHFTIFNKLYDTPTIRKYTNLLITKYIASEEEMARIIFWG